VPRICSPDWRVFQHRVLEIDAVLRFKIVGIGRRPMLIQCCRIVRLAWTAVAAVLLPCSCSFRNEPRNAGFDHYCHTFSHDCCFQLYAGFVAFVRVPDLFAKPDKFLTGTHHLRG